MTVNSERNYSGAVYSSQINSELDAAIIDQATTFKLVVNALAFQVAWFICVQGNNLAATIVCFAVLFFHWFLFKPSKSEWRLMLMASSFGLVLDTVVINLGLVDYSNSTSLTILSEQVSLMPLWLIALWVTFSTTLCHSMKWLLRRPALAAFMGFFVVPLSYWGGIRLSDSMVASNMNGMLFFIVEGLAWAGLLFVLSKKFASMKVHS